MKKTILSLSLLSILAAPSIAQQNISGGDMENWSSVTIAPQLNLEAPTGWFATDNLIADLEPMAALIGLTISTEKQLFKSDDSYSGDFSAEIITKNLGVDLGNISGVFTNGQISLDMAKIMANIGNLDFSQLLDMVIYSGGEPVQERVDSVYAYVKTGDLNQEESRMIAYATINVQNSLGEDSTVIIGQGSLVIPDTTNTFTEVSVALDYIGNETPEKLIVLFISSDMDGSSTPSEDNSLKVDDVTYSIETTNIRVPLLSEDKLLVYPNPAENIIYFNLNGKENPSDYTLSIVDIQGRVISQEELKTQINSKNTDSWSSGSYFYMLSNNQTNHTEKGQFVVK